MSRHATVRPKITERSVQETVVQLLELDGWRAIRTDPVSDRATVNAIRKGVAALPGLGHARDDLMKVIGKNVRGKGFGEVGMPDYLFLRYRGFTGSSRFAGLADPLSQSCADVLWIEFKAPGETPRPDQLVWHAGERARGALVLVIDSIDKFSDWYRASGLLRNESLLATGPRPGKAGVAAG